MPNRKRFDYPVSIPFKRESLSKVITLFFTITLLEFQFPSNGKAYPKVWIWNELFGNQQVSIPFKRESLSKAYDLSQGHFASYVSIPFKRESLSKVGLTLTTPLSVALVSIPFKRESLSKVHCRGIAWVELWRFQFPSNGKAYPKS